MIFNLQFNSSQTNFLISQIDAIRLARIDEYIFNVLECRKIRNVEKITTIIIEGEYQKIFINQDLFFFCEDSNYINIVLDFASSIFCSHRRFWRACFWSHNNVFGVLKTIRRAVNSRFLNHPLKNKVKFMWTNWY